MASEFTGLAVAGVVVGISFFVVIVAVAVFVIMARLKAIKEKHLEFNEVPNSPKYADFEYNPTTLKDNNGELIPVIEAKINDTNIVSMDHGKFKLTAKYTKDIHRGIKIYAQMQNAPFEIELYCMEPDAPRKYKVMGPNNQLFGVINHSVENNPLGALWMNLRGYMYLPYLPRTINSIEYFLKSKPSNIEVEKQLNFELELNNSNILMKRGNMLAAFVLFVSEIVSLEYLPSLKSIKNMAQSEEAV